MVDITNIELRPGGLALNFSDGSEAVGTFKVMGGILTMDGLTSTQQSLLSAFNQRIDFSAVRDPRIDGLRCVEPDPPPIELDPTATISCDTLDVAFALDVSGSMLGTISAMKLQISNYVDYIEDTTGSDYRLGLVTFKTLESDVTKLVEFSVGNRAIFKTKLDAIVIGGGGNTPESSVEAMELIVDGGLGVFRSVSGKVLILITDAPPGGFDDTYTPGVDDVAAQALADKALLKGIHIGAILTPIGVNYNQSAIPIMQMYADTTFGRYTQSVSGEAAEAILELLQSVCA